MNQPMPKVAYLSSALPALSETFVYEELLALERRGLVVAPFSVRKPATPVLAQQALAQRVTHLYDRSVVRVALEGVLRTLLFGRRGATALRWLLSDIWECGPLRLGSWKLAYQFLAATRLARLLLAQQCEHLHVHFAHTPTQIAMYASALSGVPFTVMAHANDIFDDGILLQRKAARAVRMLTISEFNVRYLASLGIPQAQLAVVRCGVSFAPRTAPPRPTHPPVFRIGSLGRMVEKKGFDVLLHAVAAMVAAEEFRVELSLAGDGPLRHELQQLTKELQIEPWVQFVGSLSHNQVAAWMQGLDAFVLACKQDAHGDMDGIPVVLMEAMSQSVPVVSTRLSGIPELILHHHTGLLAQANNVDDLALQVSHLVQSVELRAELTRNALAHVQQEFGQDINIDRLIQHITARTL